MFALRSAWFVLCLVWFALTAIACASNQTRTATPASLFIGSATPPRIISPTSTRILPSSQKIPTEQIKPLTATPHACIAWDAAPAFIGLTQCVRGNVFRTYSNGEAFFIDFDNTRRAFFGTSLTTRWEIPAGTCVDLVGTILEWQGRPYIVLDKEDVRLCDSALLPFSVALSQATAMPTRAPATIRPTRIAPTQIPVVSNFSEANVQVVRVIDGDTIDVNIGGKTYRVRYIGVDTPETVDPSQPVQCFGREASAFNKQLVEGKTVRLEKDVSETDRYGRLLRYVFVGDLFVNAELVRQGFAQVVTYPPDVKYVDLYLQFQRKAREANRGLWGACNAAPTPTSPPVINQPRGNCDPSYPDVCIPPYPPDLDCGQIPYRRFRVIGADRHRFDGDRDGIGCES